MLLRQRPESIFKSPYRDILKPHRLLKLALMPLVGVGEGERHFMPLVLIDGDDITNEIPVQGRRCLNRLKGISTIPLDKIGYVDNIDLAFGE